ncbi:unnamed protein product [Coregonus sp. 'balchen']|nr:unnamed protein product [Coregonus sp. 'balchen']
MFRDHAKYWCKGRSWPLCTVMASTDQRWSRGGMSITDIPEELVFTVTMRNLQETDTNRYWCALKVGGIGKPDVKVSLDLTVTQDSPDLSVVDELVSGEEGGSVSVQCLYSDTLRGKEKKWCRSGDRHSCQTQTDTSQNASAVISDDKRGVFNVTMRELEKKDAGWYWCSVGDLQAAVHINVTQRPTTHRNTAGQLMLVESSDYSNSAHVTLSILHIRRLHSYLCLKDKPFRNSRLCSDNILIWLCNSISICLSSIHHNPFFHTDFFTNNSTTYMLSFH